MRTERLIPELKATGRVQPYEKEFFRKDGGRVPVLIGAATFEEDAYQGVAFVLDLTERKRAAEAHARGADGTGAREPLGHHGAAGGIHRARSQPADRRGTQQRSRGAALSRQGST